MALLPIADPQQRELRERVGQCLWESLRQACGGNFLQDDDERQHVRDSCRSSICFPNKTKNSVDGKPQDLEIRLALSLFHRWKRQQQQHGKSTTIIIVTSDMGLQRQISSPLELAALWVLPLEVGLRNAGIAHDVQCHSSGLIGIVVASAAMSLDRAFRATCTTDTMAMVPYTPEKSIALPVMLPRQTSLCHSSHDNDNDNDIDNPLELIRTGNLPGLQLLIENGYTPATHVDHRGASPLLWAAGSGHLDIVRYLIETCGCDPNQPQQGKRSFGGRTALHWAARKGHLAVVQYLVLDQHVNVEAATNDGTTAFGWASWQGHCAIMEFLAPHCNIHRVNTFGCNAVLWCAQGERGDVDTMKWLHAQGCHMTQVNHNEHGVLHKAAQRGQLPICQWFWDTTVTPAILLSQQGGGTSNVFDLLGPDTEQYCPSDLAGMEGHEELARTLARWEMECIQMMQDTSNGVSMMPDWLTKTREGVSMRMSNDNEIYTWEPLGGVRRMKRQLLE
ncbi:Ankyrin Repeat [Seminavis robusta]|uniref:Ankyrin Repeat n=1 Tax=Seminavis robusta TaxID=568900 RepID=A0A9N8HI27_9STRA|nr:Ankyrin Repeat [Seminavis robusta]|eukprot:Sro599_g173130.1 Ankyrin Repeat (505) ;mRNA; r:5395-6998